MNSHRIHHRHRQQVDVNQVGTIGRNQFQQWVHAGVGSTGQSSEGGVTAASSDVFDADADLNTGFDVAAVSQSAGLYVDANPNIIRRPSCR
ncbi:unnamed protein product, partial [Rotaria magnacalcarata]